jgi:type III pantothenate kinase
MVQRYFGVTAIVVEPGVNASMPILYDNPAEVGADRIVNAVAAYEKFGTASANAHRRRLRTATTLDAITAKGEYLGGAICPGVTISAARCSSVRRACRASTSASRRGSWGGRRSGRWSRGCSGDTSGWSRLVRRMSDELGGDAVCIATGAR